MFLYKARTTFAWLCSTLRTATSATSVDRPAANNSYGTVRNGLCTAPCSYDYMVTHLLGKNLPMTWF